MEAIKSKYRRNLPHIQPAGYSFFVTFSLKGAIPKSAILQAKTKYALQRSEIAKKQSLKERNISNYLLRRRYFYNMDSQMHNHSKGPNFLRDAACAEIVKRQLEQYNGKYYDLIAYTIMPNHVHILIDLSIQIPQDLHINPSKQCYVNLHKIMHKIKGSSARYVNLQRSKTGIQVWENESFDIYIRNEKMLSNVINYILENPVRAGIVKSHEEDAFTFVKNQ